jgi:LmbE family N-acetylglucosaminyl deacetylase
MDWIFLSSHFDDVALSCGGLVWELASKGNQVMIWTICAGEPSSDRLSPIALQLHERWGIAGSVVTQRKKEDQMACRRIRAIPRYFSIADCIYRQDKNGSFLYPSEDSIVSDLHQEDQYWIDYLCDHLDEAGYKNSQFVCPLAIGNHVDHQMVRIAVEKLGLKVLYYADFPYVLKHSILQTQWKNQEMIPLIYPLSDRGITSWIKAIAAYTSQISSFWEDRSEMEKSIRDFASIEGNICFWK